MPILSQEYLYIQFMLGRSLREIAEQNFVSHENVRKQTYKACSFLYEHRQVYKKFLKFMKKVISIKSKRKSPVNYGISGCELAKLVPEYVEMCCEVYIKLCKDRSGIEVSYDDAYKLLFKKLKNVELNSRNPGSNKKKYSPFPCLLSLLDIAIILSSNANQEDNKLSFNRIDHSMGKSLSNVAIGLKNTNSSDGMIRYQIKKVINRIQLNSILINAYKCISEKLYKEKLNDLRVNIFESLSESEKKTYDRYRATYKMISETWLLLAYKYRPKDLTRAISIGRLDHVDEKNYTYESDEISDYGTHRDGNCALQYSDTNSKEVGIRHPLEEQISDSILYKESELISNPKLKYFEVLICYIISIRENIRFNCFSNELDNICCQFSFQGEITTDFFIEDEYLTMFFELCHFPYLSDTFAKQNNHIEPNFIYLKESLR